MYSPQNSKDSFRANESEAKYMRTLSNKRLSLSSGEKLVECQQQQQQQQKQQQPQNIC